MPKSKSNDRVRVLIAYDLVRRRDGWLHMIKSPGEALDSSDKATAQAMSAAYKSDAADLLRASERRR